MRSNSTRQHALHIVPKPEPAPDALWLEFESSLSAFHATVRTVDSAVSQLLKVADKLWERATEQEGQRHG